MFRIFVCCLILFIACKQKNYNNFIYYNSFPTEKQLVAKIIELDTSIFRYPFRIKMHDSIYVVMDLHNAENYLHAFNYNLQYKGSFGVRGDGVNEISTIQDIQYCSNDRIWILDSERSNLSRWSFNARMKSSIKKETISLNKDLVGTALNFVVYNDSTFIIPDYSGEHRLLWIDNKGKVLKKMGFIPTVKNYSRAIYPILSQAWRCFIDYNPNNDVLAAVTQMGEVIEIYNFKNNTYKVLFGKQGEPKFQIINRIAIPDGILGFLDVKVSDKYIYALFNGATFSDMEILRQQKGVKHIGCQYIYVFTIDGEPVVKYKLDLPINMLHINKHENKILTVHVNNGRQFLDYNI